MPTVRDTLPAFYPRTRAEWRQWLTDHHATAPGIWLVLYNKASGAPTVAYADAVEEALCFGWIDSVSGKLTDGARRQLFTPRKPRSGWARTNKLRVEKLQAAGLLMPAGLRSIEIAKANGAWESLDAVEAMVIPPDLRAALDANPVAADYFGRFSPSPTKIILQWIASAKRPETRARRITETVRLAAQNIKANQWQPKQP